MAMQTVGARREVGAYVVGHDRLGVQGGYHVAGDFDDVADQPVSVWARLLVYRLGDHADDAVDQQPDLRAGRAHHDDALANVRHRHRQSEPGPNVDHRAQRTTQAQQSDQVHWRTW